MGGVIVDLFMFTSYGGQDQEFAMFGDVDLVLSIGMFTFVDILGGLVIHIQFKHNYQLCLKRMEILLCLLMQMTS